MVTEHILVSSYIFFIFPILSKLSVLIPNLYCKTLIASHSVGKWDVGLATPEHTPIGRGYESFVGYYAHANDYWNKGMGRPQDGEAFAVVGEVGGDDGNN